MKKREAISLLFLMLSVAGCVPYPHMYQRLPNATGRVMKNSTPVGGVEIVLGEKTEEGSCIPMTAPVLSAKDGTFSIEGTKRLRLYIMAAPAEHFEQWALCFTTEDKQIVRYTRGKMRPGPLSSPASVKVVCDLAKKDLCEVIEETHGKW